MAQAVEAPSALDGMADDRASAKLFSLSSVFVTPTAAIDLVSFRMFALSFRVSFSHACGVGIP